MAQPAPSPVVGTPLEPEFVADCPYGPNGLLLDRLLEVNVEAGRISARMPTHDDLPLTREQRAHPTKHPRHINGGLMVHMTGMCGFVHAYYVLGLRHADGWIGYGGRIYRARFTKLAAPGEPLVLNCQATRMRRGETQIFVRYEFDFRQDGEQIYESEQSALWTRVD